MMQRHLTSPASRPPPGDKPPAPAPPAPPAWHRWLVPIGMLLSLWLLIGGGILDLRGTVEQLSYTTFVQRVDGGHVATAEISDTGVVSGALRGGKRYETAIPTALNDQGLARRLERNNVTITAVQTATDIGGILLSFAPLLLFVGLFWWLGRRAAGQIGQTGGLLGTIGRSSAKVFDAERPKTRFDDVAGYGGPKLEITEVVDFLKAPDRYRRAGAIGPRGC